MIVVVSGCSYVQVNNIAPGYLDTFKSIKNALVGFEDNIITQQLVDQIPYASLTLKIGKGPKGLMILESVRDKENTWISADSIYLVEKNGRIIKTEGLENNLKTVIIPSFSFKEVMEGALENLNAYYSYSNPELNNLELKFSYFIQGKEKVTILDKKLDLTLINEEVRNDYLGWHFTNQYWVDEKFFVWKSIQNISPLIPEFNIEVTKKPSL